MFQIHRPVRRGCYRTHLRGHSVISVLLPEFYEMVDEYEKRLDYAKENTDLPDSPDYKKINEFVASVNERVVKGEF